MIAAQNGNLNVVEELLNRGADPDLAAHNHTMALHLAIHSGNLRYSTQRSDISGTENKTLTAKFTLCRMILLI